MHWSLFSGHPLCEARCQIFSTHHSPSVALWWSPSLPTTFHTTRFAPLVVLYWQCVLDLLPAGSSSHFLLSEGWGNIITVGAEDVTTMPCQGNPQFLNQAPPPHTHTPLSPCKVNQHVPIPSSVPWGCCLTCISAKWECMLIWTRYKNEQKWRNLTFEIDVLTLLMKNISFAVSLNNNYKHM